MLAGAARGGTRESRRGCNAALPAGPWDLPALPLGGTAGGREGDQSQPPPGLCVSPRGTWRESVENRCALPPAALRPLPSRLQRPPSASKAALPLGPSRVPPQAGSTHRAAGHEGVGPLPPPGWSSGVSTGLCCPRRWWRGRGGVLCSPSRRLSRCHGRWPPPAQALLGGDPVAPELAES